MSVKIVVTKRPDDFHACIEGKSGAWGSGQSCDAAVGNLVSAFASEFGVKIVTPEEQRKLEEERKYQEELRAANARGQSKTDHSEFWDRI